MKKTVLSTELFGKESVFTETGKNFLAAIIASSEDAIITKDLDGIITSWNEGAHRIFGYQAEEMVGQSIRRLIPEELQHEEDAILAKLRAGERIRHFETTRVRKNGERFPISVTISPVKDDSGVIVGASKIARDITERRRAEENRFRLAAIVDSADDAIISKDLNGIVTSWNKGAQRLFGYLEEEMIGQPILRLIPEELQYEEKEILEKLHAGEKVEHYETTRLSKNGDLLQVSITISPIRNDAGKVIGASKIARDISGRKKMEFLLVQAEKLAATGRMAAAIAHEINNPLASVLNLIFLARQSSASREEIQEYLGTAESELERVSHIARQTLGYYRDNASPCEVHLHDLVQNVLSVYRTRLQSHNIVLETTFNDLRRIKVRPGEMIQVLSNVISNAMDAMPLGGSMSITVAPTKKVDRDGVQITVRDTGGGIPREHLDKVFEPFFTTKGNLGTGIGLWVANQLVQRHHGQISISSSTEPGASGTTVSIYLPFGSFEGTTAKPNGAQRDN